MSEIAHIEPADAAFLARLDAFVGRNTRRADLLFALANAFEEWALEERSSGKTALAFAIMVRAGRAVTLATEAAKRSA